MVPRMIFEIFNPDFPSLHHCQCTFFMIEEAFIVVYYLTYFIPGTAVSPPSSLFIRSRSWVAIVEKQVLAGLLNLSRIG
jgi:hypothetical protein